MTTIALSQSDRAALQLDATDKGLLIPRLTQEQKDTLGTKLQGIHDGLLIYNKETHEFCYWDSIEWQPIGPSFWEKNQFNVYFDQGSVSIGVDTALGFDLLSVAGSGIITDGLSVGQKRGGEFNEQFVLVNDTTFFQAGYLGLYDKLTTTGSSTTEIEVFDPKVEIKARGDGPNLELFNPVRDDDPEIIMRNGLGILGYHLDFNNAQPEFKMFDVLGTDKIKLESVDSGVDDGAKLTLYRDGDTEKVILDGNNPGSGDGGYLQLNDANGVIRFMVTAEENSGFRGSKMQFLDDTGSLNMEFHSLEGAKFMSGGNLRAQIFPDGEMEIRDGAGQIRKKVFSNGDIQFQDASGDTTIFIDNDLSGDGRIITQELEITGGSDVSEFFDVNTFRDLKVEPGTVVSIDENDMGKLRISSSAYDKKVVGVISGANGVESGLLMGQKSSIAYGDQPVALMGRVYVKACTCNGRISPGDELTTSKIPGYAMKATKKKKSRGAIIGKAMSRLETDKGMVLVLLMRY